MLEHRYLQNVRVANVFVVLNGFALIIVIYPVAPKSVPIINEIVLKYKPENIQFGPFFYFLSHVR